MAHGERIDRAEFEHLVRAHHLAVYESCLRITRRTDDALDATQHVFLAVLEGRLELARAEDPVRVLRWWAVRTSLARLRGARNARRTEERYVMERTQATQVGIDVDAERDEERGVLEKLVASLPEELRLALELRFRETLTFAQIGEALEVSEPTAHERVKRALERLRGEMQRLGFGAWAANLELELGRAPALVAPADLGARLLALRAAAPVASSLAALPWVWIAATAAIAVAVAFAAGWPEREAAREPRVATSAPAELESARDGGVSTASHASRASQPSPRENVAPEVAAAPQSPPAGASRAAPVEQTARTAHLRGRVVGEDGLGVGGVSVVVGPPSKGGFWLAEDRTTTRPDGSYELDVDLRLERETLEVSTEFGDLYAPKRLTLRASVGEDVGAPDLRVVRIRADVAGDYALAVHIVGDDGRALAGIPVRVFRRGTMQGREDNTWEAGGPTGATGGVELAGKLLGDKLVVVDGRDAGWRLKREPMRVDESGHRDVEIQLERGAVLAGTVRTVDGAPVAGATLHTSTDTDITVGWVQATSDAQGRFRLVGLEPEACTLSISGVAPDGTDWSAAELAVKPTREDLDVRLKRRDDPRDVGEHKAELHGRLRDASTGELVTALPDAVTVERVESATRAEFLSREAAGLLSPRSYQTAFDVQRKPPQPSSEFHVTGLEAGTYVVVARVRGHALSFAGPFELGAATVVSDVELALEKAIRVWARVHDANRDAVSGAKVFVLGARRDDELDTSKADAEIVKTEGHPPYWDQALASGKDGKLVFNAPAGIGVRLMVLHPRFLPVLTRAIVVAEGVEEIDVAMSRGR